MRITTLLILILAMIPTVIAADWVEVNIKNTWDYKSTGFCQQAGQCLVSNAYNEAWNDQPDRYWSGVSNNEKPKCIANGQYIGDHYCETGMWSSRTKLVATQLLALGLNKSSTNFALYCDTYDSVLNKYSYSTDYGLVTNFLRKFCPQPGNKRTENCANNICVLTFTNGVAFGMSINTDISGDKSPLKALNLSQTQCDSAKNNDGDYDTCGNSVWYNHDTESILYVPGISPLPPETKIINDYFLVPYNNLKNYVFSVVHKPDIQQYNYTFFNIPPAFDQLYIAKDNTDFTYSFKQTNMTLQQIDYAGWYYSNIDLPINTCDRIIKTYDSYANCEQQPNPTEFYIAAHKTPPLNKFDIKKSVVDIWQDLTGKIRVTP